MKTQRIQVGNGQYISVFFIIPIIIDIHGHRFEIYTLVSKIETILKTKEQKLIKIEAPFLDEISGLAIIKLLDKSTQITIMSKVKFMQNIAMPDMTNSSFETLIY